MQRQFTECDFFTLLRRYEVLSHLGDERSPDGMATRALARRQADPGSVHLPVRWTTNAKATTPKGVSKSPA